MGTELPENMKQSLRIFFKLIIYISAFLMVLIFRLIRPFLLVRWGCLISTRIGHFAANTEMYLCERDAGINVPPRRHVDIFCMENSICNCQLAIMWKRILRVWPYWILSRIIRVNKIIPGGAVHEIGNNTQHDRDVHNLLDRFPPHLNFTAEEKVRGEAGLRAMGIPQGVKFVCLMVRDSAYLDVHQPADWKSHNYRDNDIQNYILAAEELANRGFFVIRMGAKANEAMETTNPAIIDYAVNGMRSDFMDIYLGAECAFCVSTGSGWDAIPTWVFRKPLVSVNSLPIGYLPTFSDKFILTTKKHILCGQDRQLTLSEIFKYGVGFCLDTSDYASRGIKLVENTPEEIRDVAIEMADRLNGSWQFHEEDDALQHRFREIFPQNAVDAYQGKPLHGEIRALYGTHFLRKNRNWLQ